MILCGSASNSDDNTFILGHHVMLGSSVCSASTSAGIRPSTDRGIPYTSRSSSSARRGSSSRSSGSSRGESSISTIGRVAGEKRKSVGTINSNDVRGNTIELTFTDERLSGKRLVLTGDVISQYRS